MKEKEEFKFNKQFEQMAKNIEANGYVIPSYCFLTTEEKLKYAAYMYFNDKMTYAKTKKWPERNFIQRDLVWTYYYYLQISDCNLDLDKYFDFSYDTKKWTRKDLEKLMIKYGTSVLYKFAIYIVLEPEIDFDEWLKDYQNDNSYLENIHELNMFDKTTSK